MTQSRQNSRIKGEAQIIPWTEFQPAIAPIWNVDDPTTVPILNNPYRVISYALEEWPTRIVHFPYRYVENGKVVGYTSLYNVSDDTVRTRGVYVLKESRGNGVARRMLEAGMNLFPDGFRRLVGFFREANVEKFKRTCDMKEFPGTDWFWSTYQQIRIRMLYWDRPNISVIDLDENRQFVQDNLAEHGFGGTNNLNRKWSPEEWLEYATPHAWTYEDGKINLKF